MKFEDFRKSDLCKDGGKVWICDYRYTDFAKKPIRHIQPTQVEVCFINTKPPKKNIYYSDVYFMNKKTIISPFDTTGYRSYARVAVQVFATQDECIKAYIEECNKNILGIQKFTETVVNSSKVLIDAINLTKSKFGC